MALFQPINVHSWIEENKHLFLPPVCNKMMHNAGQVKLFFVGGPNQRKDFHIEEGEELFYMLKGDMCLKVVEQNKHRDVIIKEGDIFLLPGRIAHSPQRFANTIGLVVERERMKTDQHTELDGLRYFVEKDGKFTLESLYEDWFHCEDLGTQLKPIIEKYFASEQYKTGNPIPGTIPEKPPVVLDSVRKLVEPFSLQNWIETHKKEIHEKGFKKIFEGNYQFQVFACGQGTSTWGSDCAETWIWQLHGSSKVQYTKNEGDNGYDLGENDSMLIPCCQKFSFHGNTSSFTLLCYQDHTIKAQSYCD